MSRQTKNMMINKEASTKIVRFIASLSGGLVLVWGSSGHIVNMHYSIKNTVYFWTFSRQTKHMAIMSMEPLPKL